MADSRRRGGWRQRPWALPRRSSAHRADVGGLRALLALRHLELHALRFGQGLEARALDLAEVGEQVLAAAVGRDEAEALALIEPLHGTGLSRHVECPVKESWKESRAAHARAVQKRQAINDGGFDRSPLR